MYGKVERSWCVVVAANSISNINKESMNTLIIYAATIYLTAFLSSSVVAYTTVPKSTITKHTQQNFANRRTFLSTTIASIAAVAASNPNRVLAADD